MSDQNACMVSRPSCVGGGRRLLPIARRWQGRSLAIDGAATLGEAMALADGDYALAFRQYDAQFRPFLEQIQADAARTVHESLIPRTDEDIRARNAWD